MEDTHTRLLFIEDDQVDRMAFQRFVKTESLPYDYTVATSLSEAKAFLDAEAFDIIVADYHLGDGSALELFDADIAAPIIVVTGAGDEKIAIEAMKAGTYDYLIKDPERNYLTALPAVIRNVIGRKQAEAVLQETQAALQDLFDNTSDLIQIVTPDGEFLYVNQTWRETLGYSEEELANLSLFGIIHPDSRSHCRTIFRRVSNGETFDDVEAVLIAKDGKHITVKGQITSRFVDDAAHAIRCLFHNITEVSQLRQALQNQGRFERMIGKSYLMQDVYQLIDDIAESDTTVLILGESGTGKELVAEAIHRRSHRHDGPFVKVNCSALSEGLLESELFGHVKGAFTGAIKDKVGRFGLADGGTLFLDEIGDISPTIQIKLLRVLQEREFEPVGGTKTRRTDVRVITATNRNLRMAIAEGDFREDLYYRLYVVPIELPALRERKEDIPLLVTHFVEKFRLQMGKQISGVSREPMALMMDYEWPGNVRELENAVEHAFVKCRSENIEIRDLPLGLVKEVESVRGKNPERRNPPEPEPEMKLGGEKYVREQLLAALEKSDWNQSHAARLLGIHRTTLWRKMKTLGIEPPIS